MADLQVGLEIGHVVVTELARVAEAETAAVDDRGVVFAIAEDQVVLAADRRNGPEVRLEAGREAQRRFLAHELREPPLEFFMQLEGSVQEPRARARSAVLADGLL